MDQKNPKWAEIILPIILPLLAAIEDQLVDNVAQRLTLDLLWESFPKGSLSGSLSLELLIDQQKKGLALRVAERFQAFHDKLYAVLDEYPQRLPPNWNEVVRKLIESIRGIDHPE